MSGRKLLDPTMYSLSYRQHRHTKLSRQLQVAEAPKYSRQSVHEGSKH